MNLESAIQTFKEYVQQYNLQDEKVRLKVVHTMKVLENCQQIAMALGLSQEQQELASLLGLLHDIGRFEQIRKYQTFLDAKSENHAKLGEQILRQDNFLRNFVEEDRFDEVLYTAIHYHNYYQIDDTLSEMETLFTNILRDGDKIDIFRVAIEEDDQLLYGCSTEEFLSDRISDEVLDCIRRHQSVLGSIRSTHLDIYISYLALIFDLNYTCSFESIQAQGFYQKLCTSYTFKQPKVQQQFLEIQGIVQAYIEKRVKENITIT